MTTNLSANWASIMKRAGLVHGYMYPVNFDIFDLLKTGSLPSSMKNMPYPKAPEQYIINLLIIQVSIRKVLGTKVTFSEYFSNFSISKPIFFSNSEPKNLKFATAAVLGRA